VLAARWIGLPLIEARHFSLGPASLSVLGYNPDHPEVAVIALWNAGAKALFAFRRPSPSPDISVSARLDRE
jgi:broad specificity phosphatase PhoE